MTEQYLIVGLGNPGTDYEFTRHNAGFLVVRQLAKQLNAEFVTSSLVKGLITKSEIDGKIVHLLLPTTYMNRSGLAVKQMLSNEGIDVGNTLVVTDDLNLDFGQLRIREKGSDGGHNGLTSLIQQLGTQEFHRLRLGIGMPKSGGDTVEYVLDRFMNKELKELGPILQQSAECCLVWLNEGITNAMNQFNRRKDDE